MAGALPWPGQAESADFPSVYVIQFLIEAEQQGFAVPHYLFDRALNYLRGLSRLNGANLYQARLRAQAIYLLSVKGEQVSNALTSLHERLEQQHQSRWQSDSTAVYMAASYQLLQQPALAESLIRNYRPGQVSQLERDYKPVSLQVQPFASSQFQSQFNLDSQYLYLLARHFPERAKQLSSAQILAQLEPLFAGAYHTQAASYSILALSASTEALVQSRNVPAVTLQAQLQQPDFYQWLAANQVPLPQAADYYGLAWRWGGWRYRCSS
ncbi:hypothetical protein [Alishewanella longhuensis]